MFLCTAKGEAIGSYGVKEWDSGWSRQSKGNHSSSIAQRYKESAQFCAEGEDYGKVYSFVFTPFVPLQQRSKKFPLRWDDKCEEVF